MSNKTIVITRPSGQARQLSEALLVSLRNSGFTPESTPRIGVTQGKPNDAHGNPDNKKPRIAGFFYGRATRVAPC